MVHPWKGVEHKNGLERLMKKILYGGRGKKKVDTVCAWTGMGPKEMGKEKLDVGLPCDTILSPRWVRYSRTSFS